MSRKVNVVPIAEEPAQEEPAVQEPQEDADEINTEDLEFLIAETQERKGKRGIPKPKAECPDCGKTMSAKALKYSHVPNCKAKPLPPPPEPTPEPVKKTRAPRKPKKEEPPAPTETIAPPPSRQDIRKKRFSSLASQAF